MKKIYKLNIVALVAWMMLSALIANSQEKPGQKDPAQIKAEKDNLAQRIDPAKYFNLELVSHCELSPNGDKIVYAVSTGEEVKIFSKNLTGGEPAMISKFTATSFEGLKWFNNTYFAYKFTERNQSWAKINVVNVDNPKNTIPLAKEGQKVDWVNGIMPNDRYFFFALSNKESTSLDLMKYDFKTGFVEMQMENPGNVLQWIINNKGELVAVVTCNDEQTKLQKVLAMKKFDGEASIDIQVSDEFKPIGVTADDTQLICFSDINRENTALVAIDLSTMNEKKVLYSAANTDVLGCYFSFVNGKPVVADYGPEQLKSEFLDDAFAKAYNAARQKLSKDDRVEIVSSNYLGTVLVLRVSNPKYPTEFYLYQATSGKLENVHKPQTRESSEKTIVTRSIDIKSRYGNILKGILTSPPTSQAVIGLVVLVQDNAFERISHEYNPLVNYLCANGLVVLQVDHVGVSGYGKKHRAAGYGELDGKMIEDLVDGVEACISQHLYAFRKAAVVGSGYGGHAAMLCMLNHSDVFSAYVCETGIMTIASYAERIMEQTPRCNKMINRFYANNEIPSTSDLSSAFLGLDLNNGLDERLLMVLSPESVLYDASEASNLATICEQKNVGVNVIEIGAATTPDRKTITRMDYYSKMIDVLKMGLASGKTEK